MTTALLCRRVTVVDVLKNWFVSFFGNLAGTLFLVAIVFGCMSSSPTFVEVY